MRPGMGVSGGLDLRQLLSSNEVLWELNTGGVDKQDPNVVTAQPEATAAEKPKEEPQSSTSNPVPSKFPHVLDL